MWKQLAASAAVTVCGAALVKIPSTAKRLEDIHSNGDKLRTGRRHPQTNSMFIAVI